MIYSGGDGSSDNPYIVDTYDSFVQILKGINNDSPSTVHVKFADLADEYKIMDLRSNGWQTDYIGVGTGDGSKKLYVHGNGWTILGLSIKDTSWLFPNHDGGWHRSYAVTDMTFDDLTIKNFYVLGINGTNTPCYDNPRRPSLFAVCQNKVQFNRCKFSGVLDAIGCEVGFFTQSLSGDRTRVFNSCSFNIRFKNKGTSYSASMWPSYGTDARSRFDYQNCIFNITEHSSLSSADRTETYQWILAGQMTFCKIIGSIVREDTTHLSAVYNLFFLASQSCYNVIDLFLDRINENININSDGGNPGIINSDKLPTNVDSITYGGFVPVTSLQMVDSSYLNSIDFICGDAPT